jgi:hypothetical protein
VASQEITASIARLLAPGKRCDKRMWWAGGILSSTRRTYGDSITSLDLRPARRGENDPRNAACDLSLPFFNKDGIKETLFDTLGWKDRAWSRQLGIASAMLLFYCIEQQLEAGQSLVAESAFQAIYDAPRLEALKQRYRVRVLEVFCRAAPEVLLARIQQRAQDGQRHPGHGEQAQAEELRANLLKGTYQPLSKAGADLTVDTTDLAALEYQRLFQAISAALLEGGGEELPGERV